MTSQSSHAAASDLSPISVVTGASGYVASELIKQLLERGHHVRGTVRNPLNTEKTVHLSTLAQSQPGTLTFYAAELSKAGSFDEAVKGATYVFHVATPLNIQTDNPMRDYVEATVQGTKNVFDAIAKSKTSVKKIVITSTIGTIINVSNTSLDRPPLTEADNNPDFAPEEGGMEAYKASKILEEKEAEKFAKDVGVPLAFINPSTILGPIMSPKAAGFSINIIKSFVERGEKFPAPVMWMKVDVRDVALAHIRAAESPTAKGRHLVSLEHSVSHQAFIDILKAKFPQLEFGTDADQTAPCKVVSTEKAQRELGLHVRPIEETIIDGAVTAFQLGLASPQLCDSQ